MKIRKVDIVDKIVLNGAAHLLRRVYIFKLHVIQYISNTQS